MTKFLFSRRHAALLLSSVALTALASGASALDVASQADWNGAVAAAAAAGANATVDINITNGFTLSSSLAPLVVNASGVRINIIGNSNTINGASIYQGLQIAGTNAPIVNISNLTLDSTRARGGNGGGGGDGGGGGGLGAGGGLFIATGAVVTIDGVSFVNNTAVGGNGGTSGANSGGAGGGALNGGTGGTPPNGSGTGGPGGAGASSVLFPGGGVAGTGGGAGVSNGGVGGSGGTGGGGGGGGAATAAFSGGNGGAGGFGGGGGGGGFPGTGTPGAGGTGGYGAGSGGNGLNGTGSGGAGLGGAIFVMDGASLTVKNLGTVSGNAIQSGSNGTPVTSRGQDLFVNGVGQVVTFQVDAGSLSYAGSSQSGSIAGEGGLAKTGAGTFVISGTQSYTGATTVTAGTLVVNGSIASSSGVTVGAGATLGGSGTVPGTAVTGGTLSPGNSPGTLTVNGNLTMDAASTYRAEVQGAVADRITVTGTASLAGTLRLVPLGGSYTFNSPYTLLSAAGGRTGTFGTVDQTGTFGDGVTTTVTYTSQEVQLTLTPRPLTPIVTPTTPAASAPAASTPAAPSRFGVMVPLNAFAVASAIDAAMAGGANVSPLFNLYNLPASAIPAAVNQLSGEAHASTPAIAAAASGQFLGTMLDPALSGRLSLNGPGPGAAAFSSRASKSYDQPAKPAFLDQPLYAIWGASFGSAGRTDGSARVGSANRDVDDAHLAVGADLRIGSNTVAGIALSGGKARASLSGGRGKVESDVFQAGLYGMTRLGPVDLSAAASYGRLDNDVSRAVPVLGNSLVSSYASTVWSGRIQAAAAVASAGGFTLSPLAALQAISVRNPAFSERTGLGSNAAALNVARSSETTSRSELGAQVDGQMMVGGVPLTAFMRASWAHYFQRDAQITAGLAALAGSSFVTQGARPDANAALIAAGLDARLSERVSVGIRLDSELSANTRRLGGTAQIRVSF